MELLSTMLLKNESQSVAAPGFLKTEQILNYTELVQGLVRSGRESSGFSVLADVVYHFFSGMHWDPAA